MSNPYLPDHQLDLILTPQGTELTSLQTIFVEFLCKVSHFLCDSEQPVIVPLAQSCYIGLCLLWLFISIFVYPVEFPIKLEVFTLIPHVGKFSSFVTLPVFIHRNWCPGLSWTFLMAWTDPFSFYTQSFGWIRTACKLHHGPWWVNDS